MSKTTFSKKFNFWGPFLIFGGKTATWKTSAWSTVNYLVYTCICKDQSDVLWKKKIEIKTPTVQLRRTCLLEGSLLLSFFWLSSDVPHESPLQVVSDPRCDKK